MELLFLGVLGYIRLFLVWFRSGKGGSYNISSFISRFFLFFGI